MNFFFSRPLSFQKTGIPRAGTMWSAKVITKSIKKVRRWMHIHVWVETATHGETHAVNGHRIVERELVSGRGERAPEASVQSGSEDGSSIGAKSPRSQMKQVHPGEGGTSTDRKENRITCRYMWLPAQETQTPSLFTPRLLDHTSCCPAGPPGLVSSCCLWSLFSLPIVSFWD